MTIIRRTGALLEGITDYQLQSRCQRGELRRLRPGAYQLRDEFDALTPRERHINLLHATFPTLGANSLFSYDSAAALHDLPLYGLDLARPHITRPNRGGGGKAARGLRVHTSPVTDQSVVDGLRATGLAQTVVDLGCSLPFEQAVVIGDAALRLGASTSDIGDVLATMGKRRGGPAARAAAAFLDPLCESVGESRSRVFFLTSALPMPKTQVVIRTQDGQFIARVDFLWEKQGLIGEFDGRIKYGRLLTGRSAEETVYAEKLRQEALEKQGYRVVRWTWDDLAHPVELAELLSRLLFL
jgi:hypothetical protein